MKPLSAATFSEILQYSDDSAEALFYAIGARGDVASALNAVEGGAAWRIPHLIGELLRGAIQENPERLVDFAGVAHAWRQSVFSGAEDTDAWLGFLEEQQSSLAARLSLIESSAPREDRDRLVQGFGAVLAELIKEVPRLLTYGILAIRTVAENTSPAPLLRALHGLPLRAMPSEGGRTLFDLLMSDKNRRASARIARALFEGASDDVLAHATPLLDTLLVRCVSGSPTPGDDLVLINELLHSGARPSRVGMDILTDRHLVNHDGSRTSIPALLLCGILPALAVDCEDEMGVDEKLNSLLGLGLDLDRPDCILDGQPCTPLALAVLYRNLPVAKALILAGADPQRPAPTSPVAPLNLLPKAGQSVLDDIIELRSLMQAGIARSAAKEALSQPAHTPTAV